MSSNSDSSFNSGSSPGFASQRPYVITSTGTNNRGDHYCHRDYGPSAINQNSYHYSNHDSSYYYNNPDGSTYYNSGTGYSHYTPPPRK